MLYYTESYYLCKFKLSNVQTEIDIIVQFEIEIEIVGPFQYKLNVMY